MRRARRRHASWILGLFTLGACARGISPSLDEQGPLGASLDAASGDGSGNSGADAATQGGAQGTTGGSDPANTGGLEGGASTASNAGTNGLDDAGASANGTTGNGGTNGASTGSIKEPSPCSARACESDKTGDARTCDSVITIGRKEALAKTFAFTGDTTSAGNTQDLASSVGCEDSNADQFFRVYLHTADSLRVDLTVNSASFNAVIKLYSAAQCASPTLNAVECTDNEVDGDDEWLSKLITNEG